MTNTLESVSKNSSDTKSPIRPRKHRSICCGVKPSGTRPFSQNGKPSRRLFVLHMPPLPPEPCPYHIPLRKSFPKGTWQLIKHTHLAFPFRNGVAITDMGALCVSLIMPVYEPITSGTAWGAVRLAVWRRAGVHTRPQFTKLHVVDPF